MQCLGMSGFSAFPGLTAGGGGGGKLTRDTFLGMQLIVKQWSCAERWMEGSAVVPVDGAAVQHVVEAAHDAFGVWRFRGSTGPVVMADVRGPRASAS